MNPRVTALCSALLALALAAPAVAQEEESAFSGVLQLDVTNAYFFRGILQEREGVIIQPWTELYYSLYSSEDGFLRDLTVGGGVWTSFHSERTGATQDPQWFYEADYYPLVSMEFAGGVSLTTVYYFYTSPNKAWSTVQELNFKFAYDDSEALGDWAMAPWINFAIEMENTSFGADRGTGIQLGIGPTLWAAEDESVSLTMPVEVGLSLEDYYENADGSGNHTFGYVSAGVVASIPLGFVPESAGEWSLNLGGKVFYFNEILSDANRNKSVYPVGTASLAVAF
jgi:hypothetical protein